MVVFVYAADDFTFFLFSHAKQNDIDFERTAERLLVSRRALLRRIKGSELKVIIDNCPNWWRLSLRLS